MRSWISVITILIGMAMSGCTQFSPYRTTTLAEPPTESQPKVFECKVDERQSADLPLCSDAADGVSHSVEHRHYQVKSGSGHTEVLDYYLSAVEFDDQGWFADRKQMEALFLLLKKLEKENNGHTLIYVYAHGWKHNASPCDNNVVCFSRLLERTDAAERAMTGGSTQLKRNVVGVYLGWRGLPYNAGAFTNLSFWSRKEAAARVGRGGVFELLLRLRDYRDSRKTEDTRFNQGATTQLVVTGHSFGGLVIYSALSHALMERAAKTTKQPGGEVGYETAGSFGDFVMLVNPAFEGSLYEPLFNIATHRCYEKDTQRPVLMIVTSEADRATGTAFPIGRSLGTLLQHAKSPGQSQSIVTAIGHDSRYQTHRLSSNNVAAAGLVDESECGCPYLAATFDWELEELGEKFLAPFLDALISSGPAKGAAREPRKLGSGSYGATVRLEPESTGEYAAGYPYLVVTTDAGVIADHNAIYNDHFINFAQLFFLNHIASPRPALLPGDAEESCWRDADVPHCTVGSQLPCERSCRMPDGSPCTGP